MITLSKEQLENLISDVWSRGFGWGALGGLAFRHTDACCAFRQIDLQEFGDRAIDGHESHSDSERLAWMLANAKTGSIGFGSFVLYPGDKLDDVRAVIDAAMREQQVAK